MNFDIETTASSVDFWSDTRLPFEPKGDARQARDALRAALKAIAPTGALSATYTSPLRDFCDVENVLLYNVGTGAFSELGRRRVRLLRTFAQPERPFLHHHRYVALDASAPAEPRSAAPFAERRFTLPASLTASSVWAAARAAATPSTTQAHPSALLAVDVDLAVPPGRRFTLTAAMKVILDGVIASLHRHDGTGDVAALTGRVAGQLAPLSTAEVARLLVDGPAELGERALLHAFRDGVQWNPADDRVIDLDMRVVGADGPHTTCVARFHEAWPR
jgi:hypothetical protein